jgi:hypothetical protein
MAPGKRIQLIGNITVERQTEAHHTFEQMSAYLQYTREHIAHHCPTVQCVFGIFFGIGARVRYKTK